MSSLIRDAAPSVILRAFFLAIYLFSLAGGAGGFIKLLWSACEEVASSDEKSLNREGIAGPYLLLSQ
jgi:hypothetical protein